MVDAGGVPARGGVPAGRQRLGVALRLVRRGVLPPRGRDRLQGAPTGEHKILRCGGFHCILAELRSAERHHKPVENDSFYSGFMCAKDVE